MKKLTVLLLCFLLLCACGLPVFATDDRESDAVISTTVPDTHTVTVKADGASVYLDSVKSESFIVGRLSTPRFFIRANSDRIVTSVTVNGEDVTDLFRFGFIDFDPVYEDKVIVVTTDRRSHVPDLPKPDETEPEETEPEETEPEETEPDDPKPDDPKPDDPKPDETEPDETEPDDPKPDDPKPDDPKTHTLTVSAGSAKVFYEGVDGEDFDVPNASSPRILIRAESGKVITSVTVDGEDVTDMLHGGYLDLGSTYRNRVIVVTTEDEPVAPKETYTVTGRVTLNGEPLANVELELRSTLKTTRTDENGQFAFENVESGKHSLTALGNDKVIGYLSFVLQQDESSDVSLQKDGTYSVSIDQNGAGVDLHLVLNEELGTLAAAEVNTIDNKQPTLNLWWLWILLIVIVVLVAVGVVAVVVVVVIIRRKKAK